MNVSRQQRSRGFTLIEVLVAMIVVALGIGGLMTALSSAADAVSRMREKSFAQWIALNQIAMLRLSGEAPAVGVTQGSIEEYAGQKWNWEQEVTDPGVAGILRVEVRVAPQKAKTTEETGAPAPQTDGAPMASVGSAFSFVGSSVSRASGSDPDWSISSATVGGLGGGGGGGGTRGGGTTPGSQ